MMTLKVLVTVVMFYLNVRDGSTPMSLILTTCPTLKPGQVVKIGADHKISAC